MFWYYLKTKNKAQANYPNFMYFNDKSGSSAEYLFGEYFFFVIQEPSSIDQIIFSNLSTYDTNFAVLH